MTRQLKLTITKVFQLDDEESEDGMWHFEEIIAEAGQDWQAECIQRIYWNKDWVLDLATSVWDFEIINQETAQ